MTEIRTDFAQLERWANDPEGPVALHFRQELLPVEGKGAVFFPPTFADVGYNIDTLPDGSSVALVDSVGSQANRIEPMFQEPRFREIVPQIEVEYERGDGEMDSVSLFEVGHRLGDAVIRSTELADAAREAFLDLLHRRDATRMAKLAPTSLVFGAWDSRDTMAKVPRIVQSVIRAWDVSKLTRSAQYNPALDYAALGVISEKDKEKAEGKPGSDLAQRGFVHVPASGTHGGIIARGAIVRDVTVNLVALRRLQSRSNDALRSYVLGLSMLAASVPIDPFLRQGCLLVPDTDAGAEWKLVERTGERTSLVVAEEAILEYACESARRFGVGESWRVRFDKGLAAADLKKKAKK